MQTQKTHIVVNCKASAQSNNSFKYTIVDNRNHSTVKTIKAINSK